MRVRALAGRQRGASLIEVLVAILIVSLGVIAMGGLLASATRLGKASESRAIASLLAADIADRMKANICGLYDPGTGQCPNGVAVGSYDLTAAFVVGGSAPADAAACLSPPPGACKPDELAAIDLAQWRQSLYYGLPNGQGYVQYDAAARTGGGSGAVDVWVAWLDPKALSTNEFQDIDNLNTKNCPPGFRNLNPQPRCMYFRVGL